MRPHYFSPGPATLPDPVLARIVKDIPDTFGIGVSVLEISHRSKQYEALNEETHALARAVFGIPDSHSVLFAHVGAQQHFSLLIPQLSLPGDTIAYTDTDVWAHAACLEAQATDRNTAIVYDGAPEYRSLGSPAHWKVPKNARYLHITVNNTIYGTEYPVIPSGYGVPLVLDMTSSLGARCDIPWPETGLIYASAQKNFGIAGVSAVIMRNDLLQESAELAKRNRLGNALAYANVHKAKSALNTPPVFAIFCMNRMLQWMRDVGGVKALEAQALAKAKLVYDAIDRGGGFYSGRPEKAYRSRHNFVFKTASPELDETLISEAALRQILEIRGYRNTGGLRASMYNGVSVESAAAFATFLDEFRSRHGG